MMRNARLTMLSGANNNDGSGNTSHTVLLWSRHLIAPYHHHYHYHQPCFAGKKPWIKQD